MSHIPNRIRHRLRWWNVINVEKFTEVDISFGPQCHTREPKTRITLERKGKITQKVIKGHHW